MKEEQRFFSVCRDSSLSYVVKKGHFSFIDALSDLVKVSILELGGLVYRSNSKKVELRTYCKSFLVTGRNSLISRTIKKEIYHFTPGDNECGKLHDFICIFVSVTWYWSVDCNVISSLPSGIKDEELEKIINRGMSLLETLPKETRETVDSLMSLHTNKSPKEGDGSDDPLTMSQAEKDTDVKNALIVSILIVCGVTQGDVFGKSVGLGEIDEVFSFIKSFSQPVNSGRANYSN